MIEESECIVYNFQYQFDLGDYIHFGEAMISKPKDNKIRYLQYVPVGRWGDVNVEQTYSMAYEYPVAEIGQL